MCYNAKRGENMKLAIDAMSGDLGSSIVVEACQSFLNKNKRLCTRNKIRCTGVFYFYIK